MLYDPKLVVFASNNVNKQTRLEAPTDGNQSDISGGSGKLNLGSVTKQFGSYTTAEMINEIYCLLYVRINCTSCRLTHHTIQVKS